MALYVQRGNALTFHVRLTPKGGRDAVEGWANASDGKANVALTVLLAKELGVTKSALAITGGEKARLKTIAVTGDTSALAARLEMFGEG